LKRSAGGWPTNPHLLPPGWSAIFWMLPSLFATLSDRGRRVPELNDNQYRELLTRNYRIVYRHEGGEASSFSPSRRCSGHPWCKRFCVCAFSHWRGVSIGGACGVMFRARGDFKPNGCTIQIDG
jgi:hypothetical protein